jgi:hypothetical protein
LALFCCWYMHPAVKPSAKCVLLSDARGG